MPIFGKLEIDNPSAFTCSWGFQPDDGGEFDQNLGSPVFLSGPTFVDRINNQGYSVGDGLAEEDKPLFSQRQIDSGKFREFANYWKSKGGNYNWPTSAPSELNN